MTDSLLAMAERFATGVSARMGHLPSLAALKAYSESKHPRAPKGHPRGGTWKHKPKPLTVNDFISTHFPATPIGETRGGFITRDGELRGIDTTKHTHGQAVMLALEQDADPRWQPLRKEIKAWTNKGYGWQSVYILAARDGLVRVTADNWTLDNPASIDFMRGTPPNGAQLQTVRDILREHAKAFIERDTSGPVPAPGSKLNNVHEESAEFHLDNQALFDLFLAYWRKEGVVFKSADSPKRRRRRSLHKSLHTETMPVVNAMRLPNGGMHAALKAAPSDVVADALTSLIEDAYEGMPRDTFLSRWAEMLAAFGAEVYVLNRLYTLVERAYDERWDKRRLARETLVALRDISVAVLLAMALRWLIRRALREVLDRDGFLLEMLDILNRSLRAEYMAGKGGVPMTDEDEAFLAEKMAEQADFAGKLADDVMAAKGDPAAEAKVMERPVLWGQTVATMQEFGAASAKPNELVRWRLGTTKEHCSTCLFLNGQVHPRAWFIAQDYIPQKPGAAMVCGGWNCGCTFEVVPMQPAAKEYDESKHPRKPKGDPKGGKWRRKNLSASHGLSDEPLIGGVRVAEWLKTLKPPNTILRIGGAGWLFPDGTYREVEDDEVHLSSLLTLADDDSLESNIVYASLFQRGLIRITATGELDRRWGFAGAVGTMTSAQYGFLRDAMAAHPDFYIDYGGQAVSSGDGKPKILAALRAMIRKSPRLKAHTAARRPMEDITIPPEDEALLDAIWDAIGRERGIGQKAYDESKHPRAPKGHPQGGEWKAKLAVALLPVEVSLRKFTDEQTYLDEGDEAWLLRNGELRVLHYGVNHGHTAARAMQDAQMPPPDDDAEANTGLMDLGVIRLTTGEHGAHNELSIEMTRVPTASQMDTLRALSAAHETASIDFWMRTADAETAYHRVSFVDEPDPFRVILKALRAMRALKETGASQKAYEEAEHPRAPKGHPDAGKWVQKPAGVNTSKARYRFPDDPDAKLKQQEFKRLWEPRGLSLGDLPTLMGLDDNDAFRLEAVEETHVTVSGILMDEYGQAQGNMWRAFWFRNGKPDHIINSSFEIYQTGTGMGAEVFAREVEAAKSYGFKQILADCMRATEANGYYTWARLGYDVELKRIGKSGTYLRQMFTTPIIAPELMDSERLSDLMATPKGRDIWRFWGVGFHGIFDLADGSTSLRVLRAYMAERAKRAANASGERAVFVISKEYDESKHPRQPKGNPKAGEWKRKRGLAASQPAATDEDYIPHGISREKVAWWAKRSPASGLSRLEKAVKKITREATILSRGEEGFLLTNGDIAIAPRPGGHDAVGGGIFPGMHPVDSVYLLLRFGGLIRIGNGYYDGQIVLDFQTKPTARQMKALNEILGAYNEITIDYSKGKPFSRTLRVTAIEQPYPRRAFATFIAQNFKEYDESKHPRQPKGHPKGGEVRRAGMRA